MTLATMLQGFSGLRLQAIPYNPWD